VSCSSSTGSSAIDFIHVTITYYTRALYFLYFQCFYYTLARAGSARRGRADPARRRHWIIFHSDGTTLIPRICELDELDVPIDRSQPVTHRHPVDASLLSRFDRDSVRAAENARWCVAWLVLCAQGHGPLLAWEAAAARRPRRPLWRSPTTAGLMCSTWARLTAGIVRRSSSAVSCWGAPGTVPVTSSRRKFTGTPSE